MSAAKQTWIVKKASSQATRWVPINRRNEASGTPLQIPRHVLDGVRQDGSVMFTLFIRIELEGHCSSFDASGRAER
jgi:hypothetical protein